MSESPLFGLRVVVSQFLAGGKRAVKVGGTVYVSPAMFGLMSHATPDELERLLRSIELVELPEVSFDLPPAVRR